MKTCFKILFVIGMLTSGVTHALDGLTLEEGCQIMKARIDNKAFILEMMKVCMQRGDGVSDWTDADDQVMQCRYTAFQTVGGYTDFKVNEGYARFLSEGGDPKTCKLPK